MQPARGSAYPLHVRVLVVTAVALLALAVAPAAAAPPSTGILVPGTSLGGLPLGDTEAEVEAAWGRAYGRCRNCPRETWYFNYFAFQPRGAAVEFRRERVAAIYTLYEPTGWRTRIGLELGDPVARVTSTYGALLRTECGGYYALLLPRRGAVTAFYVLDDRVWAFGLLARGLPVCR
jgi:hypothetical protein